MLGSSYPIKKSKGIGVQGTPICARLCKHMVLNAHFPRDLFNGRLKALTACDLGLLSPFWGGLTDLAPEVNRRFRTCFSKLRLFRKIFRERSAVRAPLDASLPAPTNASSEALPK